MRIASQNDRVGGAVVEFAVIAPLLVTLVLGTVEVTRAIQVKNVLTDTARSGCRIAIESGANSQSVKDNINTILTQNGIDTKLATTTILVNNKNVDASTAVKYDIVSVKIALPIAGVNWVSPLFFPKLAVESETLVMMRH
jgi:Flp pilus assembly protein TadG